MACFARELQDILGKMHSEDTLALLGANETSLYDNFLPQYFFPTTFL
jgi:hypothetical protein